MVTDNNLKQLEEYRQYFMNEENIRVDESNRKNYKKNKQAASNDVNESLKTLSID